jgi:hypothetical protein
MNQYSTDKIKELNAVRLLDSKEWKKSLKKLQGRQVYWTYKQDIFTIKYICPMTLTIWFTRCFNGWKDNVNAIDEMYLIPNK